MCYAGDDCAVWSAAGAAACKQFVRAHGTSEVTSIAAAEPMTCLSGAKNGELAVCRQMSGEVVQKWNAHGKEITKVACGGQNRQLFASASRDKTFCIWRSSSNCADSGPEWRFSGHDLAVTGVAFNPSGSHVFSGSRDNTVRLWDVVGRQCVRTTALSQNVVTDVCWGRVMGTWMVAQSSEDKTVRLWDTRSLRVTITTVPKQYIQMCCDLSGADDRLCLSASNGFGGSGCEATLWDLRSGSRVLREFVGHFETVSGCCFVPSSSRVMAATCSNDGTVCLWDCDSGVCLASLSIPASGPLTSIASSVDCSLYVSSFFAGIQVLSVREQVSGMVDMQRVAEF